MGEGILWGQFKDKYRALSKEMFCERFPDPFLLVSYKNTSTSIDTDDSSDQGSETVVDEPYQATMTIYEEDDDPVLGFERRVYNAGFKNKASRTLQIGRAPDSDLIMNFKGMSKRHAFMMKTFRSEEYLIMDNHSMNGTKVNGKLLEEGEKRPLEIGDKIGFGSKVLAEFHAAESLYWLVRT